jgi:PncC family amidohydrolase
LTESAEEVLALARRLKRTRGYDASWADAFTFAESCTGGLVASSVASRPGASEVFSGSAVTYGNAVKTALLGVSPETLERYGAVSPQCAAEMARGARRLFGAVVGVSVTGIAGPGGGSPEKPVGTVWFAAACEDGSLRVRRGFYPGRDRDGVRRRAALSALEMLAAALRYEITKDSK